RQHLAAGHAERHPPQHLDALRPFFERLADVVDLKSRCVHSYPLKTRAGSMRATRRKAKRAAPRHMSTVPAKTAAPNEGVSVTARRIFAISGRTPHEAAPPSTKPTTAAMSACSPRMR